ncbi:MAG TPA: DNRLRE domain-containing protein, partial [Candidatus Saccharimonadales bacterium]|nr:DNRLRE domain-containing protein [Candidatus Saccharimonadales bacterium]
IGNQPRCPSVLLPNMSHSVSPRCAFLVCALLFVNSLWCSGGKASEVITLNPDLDTCIREYNPVGAYGDSSVIIAGTTGPNSGNGRNRGLIHFPLSAIPPEAVVTGAALSLSVVRVPPIQADANFELRRVIVPWSESATWGTPGASWHAPGGMNGLDFLEENSASQLVPNSLDTYTFGPSDGLRKDVQFWLATPASNFGWIIYPSQEDIDFTARQFASKESASPPVLQVTFVVPPKITKLEVESSQVIVHFQSRAGYAYRVEYREQLGPGEWTSFASFPSQASNGELTALDDAPRGTRFYRVVIP